MKKKIDVKKKGGATSKKKKEEKKKGGIIGSCPHVPVASDSNCKMTSRILT